MAEHGPEEASPVDRVMERSILLDQVSGTLHGQASGERQDPAARANEAVRRLRSLGARSEELRGAETTVKPPKPTV